MAAVKDRDALLRVNFLYQAAHCVLAGNPENGALVRFLCHTQRTVCRRLVLRQDPSVKRTVCRRCSSLLVPGISATVRQRRRAQRVTVIGCLTCGASRRFLNRPGYLLWTDRPEALLPGQPPRGAVIRHLHSQRVPLSRVRKPVRRRSGFRVTEQ